MKLLPVGTICKVTRNPPGVQSNCIGAVVRVINHDRNYNTIEVVYPGPSESSAGWIWNAFDHELRVLNGIEEIYEKAKQNEV